MKRFRIDATKLPESLLREAGFFQDDPLVATVYRGRESVINIRRAGGMTLGDIKADSDGGYSDLIYRYKTR
jgi:hypothetical protein